jgi:hypothetical protein
VDGSAVLNSFGPNMLLARKLLDRGEREVVLAYIERCGSFWGHEETRRRWVEEIGAGKVPDFGGNPID